MSHFPWLFFQILSMENKGDRQIGKSTDRQMTRDNKQQMVRLKDRQSDLQKRGQQRWADERKEAELVKTSPVQPVRIRTFKNPYEEQELHYYYDAWVLIPVSQGDKSEFSDNLKAPPNPPSVSQSH